MKLLVRFANQRLSAKQVLQHPWVQQVNYSRGVILHTARSLKKDRLNERHLPQRTLSSDIYSKAE